MTDLLALALPASLDGPYRILVFLIMLSVLIVLHEYGHFLLARRNGVRVNDFAIGFGPTLVRWTSSRSGTNYRINLLPIGGYCAMKGEDGKSTQAEQQRRFRERGDYEDDNFQAKSAPARLAIVLAGPSANFVLAFAILLAAALVFGIPNDKASTEIGPLSPGYPAERAGMRSGDVIVSVDGVRMRDGDQLVDVIHSSAGKRLHIVYSRHGVLHAVDVTPVLATIGGRHFGRIGFSPLPEYRRVGPIAAVTAAAQEFGTMFSGTATMLGALVMHPRDTFADLSGPIGMARMGATVQDLGWAPYLQLAAMISMSLAFFNLLPIPALDGGRAAFIVVEMVRGRPVDPEKEALVHVAGFAALMVLMIFVAYHDIANIVSGKGVF
jgi:regulator of sigma E protease